MHHRIALARVGGLLACTLAAMAVAMTASMAADPGDADKGRELFRVCAACHTLVPGRHMTGPSLAEIWGRKAGTVAGFGRYSEALKEAEIVWDERTLGDYLKDPKGFIPKNRMTFRGIPNERHRRDLIAFLQQVAEGYAGSSGRQADSMQGMTGQPQLRDLKELGANSRIASLGHCRDTYTVTTESGETHQFWEFNLRFKTDGSDLGPPAGRPVIIPASMRGDRAFVVFATPAEISAFIKEAC